jgi:hypothetical protein
MHLLVIQAQTNLIGGHAWLADLKDGGANPKWVTDVDLIIRKPIDRKVLAEIAVDELRSAKIALPIAIGGEPVDHHGPLLTAVTR